MLKNLRKYGWWVITLSLYVAVLVAYVSPLPKWIWFLTGVVFMAFWVKAENVSNENAAKELAAQKKYQEGGDGVALGEDRCSANAHLRPYSDYYLSNEERLREAISQEIDEALAENTSDLEVA